MTIDWPDDQRLNPLTELWQQTHVPDRCPNVMLTAATVTLEQQLAISVCH
jgi:hypothetical protein